MAFSANTSRTRWADGQSGMLNSSRSLMIHPCDLKVCWYSRWLSLVPTGLQVVLLLRCHRPPEDRIAVREAAETANDLAMALRVRQIRLAQAAYQCHRALLIGEVLGMGERQIEELCQAEVVHLIMPSIDGRIGDQPRMTVGRIHACRAAEGVAGKLIEQDDERQCAVGAPGPAGQFAARCRLMRSKKVITKALVEGIVLREPKAGPSLPPELDNGAGLSRDRKSTRLNSS